MLVPGGRFLFVTGDYDYHVSPRFGYQVTVQDIGKGEAATATVRPQGVMHDIFRPLDNYVAYAKAAGFSMTAHVAMRPTPELIAAVPHYEAFKEMALSHLLVLEKD